MAKSTSARSRGAPTPAISRLPVISGTIEHTILAPAIFARTGARMSPAAGGSRNIPPMRCRLSLKASSKEAGGSSSNSGNVGKRPVDAWQVGTDRGQDVVAAAHCFAPRFALYQL